MWRFLSKSVGLSLRGLALRSTAGMGRAGAATAGALMPVAGPRGAGAVFAAAAGAQRAASSHARGSSSSSSSSGGGGGSGETTQQFNTRLARLLRVRPDKVAQVLASPSASLSVTPDTRTCNLVLAALAKSKSLDAVHGLIATMRGEPAKKTDVVPTVPLPTSATPDVVSYTTAMSAAFASGEPAQGMQFYSMMKDDGIAPSHITYQVLLSAFLDRGEVIAAERVLGEYVNTSVRPQDERLKRMEQELASGTEAVTEAHVRAARKAFRMVQSRANKFATFIVSAYTKGASRNNVKLSVDEISRFLDRLVNEFGLVPDVKLYTTLVSSYAKAGQVDAAEATFKTILASSAELGIKLDAPVFNALLHALLKARRHGDVLKYLQIMNDAGISANTVTYSVVLQTHMRSGNYPAAEAVFDTFRASGLNPDVIMYNILVSGQVHRIKTLDPGAELPLDPPAYIWSLLDSMDRDSVRPNVRTLTALMDLASISGHSDLAFKLLDELPDRYPLRPNVYSYNVALRTALANGDAARAAHLQDTMKANGVLPDVVTFTTLARYGQISDADRKSFISFLVDKGLKPDRGSYALALRELLDSHLAVEGWTLFASAPGHIRRSLLRHGLRSQLGAALAALDPETALPDGVSVEDARAVVKGSVKLDDVLA